MEANLNIFGDVSQKVEWLFVKYCCHFPCGSADWNIFEDDEGHWLHSHFPCGSADWNQFNSTEEACVASHFPCGSADWNRLP